MAFYRTITIAHGEVPSDQTNYPFGFIGTLAYLATVANGGKVQNANGYDIYFSSDSAGSSVLNFERVHWNATNGVCEFWVQIPTLSSSVDTVIYLQYGNSTINTDQSNAAGTWDSNYVGVYHFGDGSSLSVADSTSNANNGTNNGGTASNIGITGSGIGSGGGAGALTLNGSSYVDLGTGSSLDISGSITLECWAINTGGGTDRSLCSRLDSSPNGWFYECNTGGADGVLDLCNAGTIKNVSGRSVTLTNWQWYVGTYDGTSMKFYTDASLDATTSASGALAGSSAHAIIGADPRNTSTNTFTGSIDELRISKTNRSADWITTEYNNLFSPGSFTTVGSEQTNGTPLNESLSDALSLSDSQLYSLQLAFALSDTNASNWGDTVQFNLSVPGIALSDDFSGNWIDAVTLFQYDSLTFSDTVILNDFGQPASNMDAFIDQLSFSDSTNLQVNVVVSLSDTLSLNDSVQIVRVLDLSFNDTINLSDALSFYIPLNSSFSDFFIWRDSQVVQWSSVLPPLTDQLTLSDSVTINNVPFWTPVSHSLSDTLSLNDGASVQNSISLSFNDDFAFSDAVVDQDTYYPFNQQFSDNLGPYEDSVLIIVEGKLFQFADTLALSDNVLVANTTNFNSYIRRYLNDEPV